MTTSSRRPTSARPRYSSDSPSPYTSAVSKCVTPASSAAATTSRVAAASSRRPKLLVPSPASETRRTPILRRSMRGLFPAASLAGSSLPSAGRPEHRREAALHVVLGGGPAGDADAHRRAALPHRHAGPAGAVLLDGGDRRGASRPRRRTRPAPGSARRRSGSRSRRRRAPGRTPRRAGSRARRGRRGRSGPSARRTAHTSTPRARRESSGACAAGSRIMLSGRYAAVTPMAARRGSGSRTNASPLS